MAEYKKYINALRKCAKEHENEIVSFSHVRTTDLCNDTADLLERLEAESNITIPIPEDATNGDMMKAVFPDKSTFNGGEGAYFKKDWWNAAYKKEVE